MTYFKDTTCRKKFAKSERNFKLRHVVSFRSARFDMSLDMILVFAKRDRRNWVSLLMHVLIPVLDLSFTTVFTVFRNGFLFFAKIWSLSALFFLLCWSQKTF